MPIIATLGDANIIGNTVSQANLTVLGAYSNLTGALLYQYVQSTNTTVA